MIFYKYIIAQAAKSTASEKSLNEAKFQEEE
jgi:hypothetical protein